MPFQLGANMPELSASLTPKEMIDGIMNLGISFDMIVKELENRITERSLRRWKAGTKPQRPSDIKALQDLYSKYTNISNIDELNNE